MDGIEALNQLANDSDIAVVLTDLNMPNMDGLTFLGELEKLQSSTKAVVMSAYDDMTNIRSAMNRGAFDFLTKPVDFQDVEITIGKTLNLAEQLELSRHAQKLLLTKEVAKENYYQLKELESLRDSLIHMVVHDLRTPLTSYIAALQSVADMGELNDLQRECLEISLIGGESLLGMINDLLEISKMEADSLELERTGLEISEIVALCLREVAALAGQKSLVIKAEIVVGLLSVYANEEKLRRTLVNLLENAIKFTPDAGEIKVTVEIDGLSTGVLLSISDSGEGTGAFSSRQSAKSRSPAAPAVFTESLSCPSSRAFSVFSMNGPCNS
ncbi:sensor histidine kinase TmoS [Abditibacteriota bacterium]|nr:sensor histidine kinase TmoS [Abditibacteriota bacterium]